MNAGSLDFSNARRRERATRGYVDHIVPSTQSGETDSQYSRRASRVDYVQGIQRKTKAKRTALLLAMLLLVALVGVGVGAAVYFGHSDSKLALTNEEASAALVEPVEGEPYYALCVAELGTATASDDSAGDAYILARIDEVNRAVSFVSIPSHLAVTLSDGASHPLYDALDIGGEAELISAVAAFAGVDIARYAHTDAQGIVSMVDKLGGLHLTLSEEVDDPTAGALYLQAGEQDLDGNAVLTLLRASNFSEGLDAQAQNRIAVLQQMAAQALALEGLGFATELADMADNVQTSLNASALMALGDAMRPFNTVVTYAAVVPGYEMTSSSGTKVYVETSAKWATMMENVDAGRDPNAESAQVMAVDRSGVTVEVRNGGGVTGAGAKMGELLTGCGYQLAGVGNTDDGATYPETLVIYKDEAYADAAAAIVSDTGAGRVVNGGDFYTFEDNVLVIVGKDWVPTA